jgi:hypothetical protein
MITKKQLLSYLVLFLSYSTFGQENQVSVGSGGTFFGSGDIIGNSFNFKYQRNVNKRISVFGQFGISSGETAYTIFSNQTKDLIEFSSNNSQKAHFGVAFKLLNRVHHAILLNPSVGFIKTSKFRTGGYSLNSSPNVPKEFQYLYSPPTFRKSQGSGFGIGVEHRYLFKNNAFLGSEVMLQKYQTGDIDSSLGINLGFQF